MHTVGPMMNPDPPMILFVPDISEQMFTDPSYHLPAFYELWSRWGPKEDREFWAKAAETSRGFFVKATNPETGLAPDYANFDGTPHASRFSQSDKFAYDAWRTASNWAVDWSWWKKRATEQELSDRIQKFFASQGIEKYGPVYPVDGNGVSPKPGQTPPTGLVGTNAVTGLAALDRARAKEFTEALWNAQIPSGQYRYYDGMLYLMSLMHAGGEFRIIAPK
jgi:oligosaccharide reducing-end xylanase